MPAHEKIYARFLSPGTFVHEESRVPLETGTVDEALRLSSTLVERHGARPFGFMLLTMLVHEPIPDGRGGTLEVVPKELERSGMYFLGGQVLRFEEVRAQEPPESVLSRNMENNDFPIVIETVRGYRAANPFRVDDVSIDPETGKVVVRGDDPELVAYRAACRATWKQECEAWKAEHSASS